MKNINTGLGYLATTAITIATFIVTKSADSAFIMALLCFLCVNYKKDS